MNANPPTSRAKKWAFATADTKVFGSSFGSSTVSRRAIVPPSRSAYYGAVN